MNERFHSAAMLPLAAIALPSPVTYYGRESEQKFPKKFSCVNETLVSRYPMPTSK